MDVLNEINFEITNSGPVSSAFRNHQCYDFKSAFTYVKHLPYQRNAEKTNLCNVLIDGYGTCSTKHALLKQLAQEHSKQDLHLILGIFKMNATNSKKVASTLAKYNLEHLPEAHNYLRYKGEILDCTNSKSSAQDFEKDLISEIEIDYNQITHFKVNYHQQYLSRWLQSENLNFSLAEIWSIREQCINDLFESN